MCGKTFKAMSVLVALLLMVMVMGCSGSKTMSGTNSNGDVDVFFSKAEIEKEYTIVSYATGCCSSEFGRNQVENTLIKKARGKGADAVLITEVDPSEVDQSNGSRMLRASYLKYAKTAGGTSYSRN